MDNDRKDQSQQKKKKRNSLPSDELIVETFIKSFNFIRSKNTADWTYYVGLTFAVLSLSLAMYGPGFAGGLEADKDFTRDKSDEVRGLNVAINAFSGWIGKLVVLSSFGLANMIGVARFLGGRISLTDIKAALLNPLNWANQALTIPISLTFRELSNISFDESTKLLNEIHLERLVPYVTNPTLREVCGYSSLVCNLLSFPNIHQLPIIHAKNFLQWNKTNAEFRKIQNDIGAKFETVRYHIIRLYKDKKHRELREYLYQNWLEPFRAINTLSAQLSNAKSGEEKERLKTQLRRAEQALRLKMLEFANQLDFSIRPESDLEVGAKAGVALIAVGGTVAGLSNFYFFGHDLRKNILGVKNAYAVGSSLPLKYTGFNYKPFAIASGVLVMASMTSMSTAVLFSTAAIFSALIDGRRSPMSINWLPTRLTLAVITLGLCLTGALTNAFQSDYEKQAAILVGLAFFSPTALEELTLYQLFLAGFNKLISCCRSSKAIDSEEIYIGFDGEFLRVSDLDSCTVEEVQELYDKRQQQLLREGKDTVPTVEDMSEDAQSKSSFFIKEVKQQPLTTFKKLPPKERTWAEWGKQQWVAFFGNAQSTHEKTPLVSDASKHLQSSDRAPDYNSYAISNAT